jgi:Insertion element 4 transposase N-terminal
VSAAARGLTPAFTGATGAWDDARFLGVEARCLFADLGYPQVWRRLVAGLDGLPAAFPTASAMTQARRRLGPAPLRVLFDLLRGPAAVPAGTRWRGLLTCAIDRPCG